MTLTAYVGSNRCWAVCPLELQHYWQEWHQPYQVEACSKVPASTNLLKLPVCFKFGGEDICGISILLTPHTLVWNNCLENLGGPDNNYLLTATLQNYTDWHRSPSENHTSVSPGDEWWQQFHSRIISSETKDLRQVIF